MSKLTAFVALVVILSASVLNWLSYRYAQRNLTDQIQQLLETVGYDRVMRINAYTAQKKNEIILIASRTRLRNYLADRLHDRESVPDFLRGTQLILNDAKAGSPEYYDIWITDPEGRVVTATNDQYLGRNFVNHPDFQQGKKTAHLGLPRRVEDRFQAYLTSPVKTNDGRFLGVVMVVLDLAELRDLLGDRTGLGQTGEILVASRDGDRLNYLLPPMGRPEQTWVAVDHAPAMLHAIEDSQPGRNISNYEGVMVLAAWRPIKYQAPDFRRWGMVAKIDKDEAYAPIADLRNSLWRLEALLVVLSIIVALLLARSFARPILQIADTATRVSEGDLDARVHVNRTDELGRLASNFNQMIRDISENTIELAHAKENLRFLYEYNPLMYFTVTPEGTILSVNKLVTEELGYTIDELIGQSVVKVYVDNEREAILAQFTDCTADPGTVCEREVRNVRKNGDTIWVKETMNALESPDGRMVILMVCRDITKRKCAEEALFESEERYRGVVEDIPVLICIFLPGGEILFVNNTYCNYFQKTVRELVGSNFLLSIPESDRKTIWDNLSALTADSPSQTHEHHVIAPDGEIRWQRWTNRAVFNDQGTIASYQSIGEDITERKKLEAIMEAIHQGTARATGEMFFRELTRCLAEFLNIRCAWVGKLLPNNEMETVSIWSSGDWVENFTYSLAGTPSEYAIRQTTCFYPSEVRKHFPDDRFLVDMNVESYIGTPLRDAEGKTIGLLVVVDDSPMMDVPLLTRVLEVFAARAGSELARREAEEELQILSRAVESSSAVVIITDPDDTIEYVNPKFTETTGYSRNEAVGQHIGIIRTDETPKFVFDELKTRIASKGEWKGEIHSRKKDGNLYWDRCSVSCVKNRDGEIIHYVSIQEDVTREYTLTAQLNYQATHDPLTGLVNRHEFERRAEQLISTIRQDKTEHALCFLDLDQFKVVNDTCGHTAGDEMLRQFGSLLLTIVRKHDTLARLGGDEFGILMEQCSLDQANRVADLLQKAIQDYQFTWKDRNFRVGVSIGLVAITDSMQNLTELLKQADAACYMAKDRGRNRIHVYHPEDVEIVHRHGEMQWVARIYRALEEHRFCLAAQPIVSLHEITANHYELLLRMIDEEGQLTLPGAFLPAAERYNLISILDRWVIQQAFILIAQNQPLLNRTHFFSINVSGQSIADESFLEFVVDQFRHSGIEGNKICFEITETAAISNLSKADIFISRCRQFGCWFALDDFGSGVSSFGYLKNLTVDYLKIDGMFVRDIVNDPIDYAMVKAINEIGKVMGMRTIAEFVENNGIKSLLQTIGVDYAQGYVIGKPQPLEELLRQPVLQL